MARPRFLQYMETEIQLEFTTGHGNFYRTKQNCLVVNNERYMPREHVTEYDRIKLLWSLCERIEKYINIYSISN